MVTDESTEATYPDYIVDGLPPPGELLLVYRLQCRFHSRVVRLLVLACVVIFARRCGEGLLEEGKH